MESGESKVVQSEPDRRLTSRARHVGTFCYFWLLIGFILGTAVLLWPVRWLTAALHTAGASQALENGLVILLVVLYVALSIWLALRMTRFVRGCGTPAQRWGSIGALSLIAFATAWTWRNPGRVLSGLAGGGNIASLETSNGAVFEFGAYPDSGRLAEFARQHVTVVSLEDPEIPVEREGVEAEKQLAAALRLRLISAPMMPWFSANTASLSKIREIARTGRGRYYVHCGLGRDRVTMAKRVIEAEGATTRASRDYRTALGFEGRKEDFDQGSLISLAPGYWIVPHPLKEEIYSCFFQGRPGHVVLMFDSTAAPQDSLLRENRALLSTYAVPYTVINVASDSIRRRAAVDSAVRLLRGMKPPVTVMTFHTPWHDGRQRGDEAAVALADAFSPNHSWRITTGTVVHTGDRRAYTGGNETGC